MSEDGEPVVFAIVSMEVDDEEVIEETRASGEGTDGGLRVEVLSHQDDELVGELEERHLVGGGEKR